MRTYHVGLLLRTDKKGNQVAQFQARLFLDNLSCELYEYYGQRETTKSELNSKLKSLAMRQRILADLQKDHPNVIRILKSID